MDKVQTAKWLAAAGASTALALSGGFLVKPYEGEVKDRQGYHIAYLDAVGIPTICYGQTGNNLYGKKIALGMKLTDAECMEMLSATLRKFEKEVDKMVKVEYASVYQKAALISFAYNVGSGALGSSSLLRALNAGDHQTACTKLTDWVYAQKKKLRGLEVRRNEEMQWCLGNVPYEVEVTYNEIVDMVKDTTGKK